MKSTSSSKNYIEEVDVEMCGVDMEVGDYGYPTIGARNIMSCIGNAHCIKGNANTYELARKNREAGISISLPHQSGSCRMSQRLRKSQLQ